MKSPASVSAVVHAIIVLMVSSLGGGWASVIAADAGRGDAGAQQPDRPITVAVKFVQVDVTVTDGRGRLVRDLPADAFELYEDGKPQQVSTFAVIDIPIERQGPPATNVASIEADVHSNLADSVGRVYVIILDDLHVHPLRSVRVKDAARVFIERHLSPNDRVAVVHTSGRPGLSQEFTSRRSLLLESVEKFVGRKMRSSVLERLEEYRRRADEPSRADLRMERVLDPLDAQRADQARRALKTLSNLGNLLSHASDRRKTVLLISEGIDYPLQQEASQTTSGLSAFTSPYAADVLREVQQAINAAARGNMSIYSLDPRGLAGTGDETIDVSTFPDNPHLGLSPGAFQAELQVAQDSLRMLSDQTGGVASVTSNDFAQAFNTIVGESSMYYMLGYRLPETGSDGRHRKIDVRVRRPGVSVRARTGYVAFARAASAPEVLTSSTEPSAVLRRFLNAPLASGSLPLRVFAAPFRGGTEASVLVGVEIGPWKLQLQEKAGVYVGLVEAAVAAFDQQGKFTDGDRQAVTLELRPETYKAVQSHGLRLLFRLRLPAGRYQLRAAAHSPAGTGASGSVFHDVDVPEFQKVPLAVSGLVLTAARAKEIPTAREDPALQSVLPAPPTGLRVFRPGDGLTALVEVYRGAEAASAKIDVVTTLRDAHGVRFETTKRVAPDSRRGHDGAFIYLVGVPLGDRLTVGSYILRVEARLESSPGRGAAREVPFEIVRPDPAPR